MKRSNKQLQEILTIAFGIVSACAVGIILLRAQNYQALRSFGALLNYSVFNGTALSNTLVKSAPLLLTGISAAIAFGSGAVNLGQPGQLILGAIMVTLVGLWVDAHPIIMVPLLFCVGIAAGSLWAGVAVLLRRLFDMDEFITTLMLNFIAEYFAIYLASVVLIDNNLSSVITPPINSGGFLPQFGRFPTEILIALVVFAGIYIWVRYTRVGYELKLLGKNSVFTRVGGCDNNANFSRAMMVSGALAGLAGTLLIMGGQQHRFIRGIGANYAWDGVMIAIVAASGIGATLFYAFFFGILQTGSLGMEIETTVPSEFVLVFQAFVVLFVVAARESMHVLLDKIKVRIYSRTVGAPPPPEIPPDEHDSSRGRSSPARGTSERNGNKNGSGNRSDSE